MSARIFVSYRKADEPGFTGRIYDRLTMRFGDGSAFMDTGALKPGRDYVQQIFGAVERADLVLAVVGKTWADITSEGGGRRLESEADWVRIEIETAFALGKYVIPVLIGETSMPAADALPQLMRPMVSLQAVRIRHDTFNDDVARLLAACTDAFVQVEADKSREAQAINQQEGRIGAWRPLNRIEIDKRASESVLPQEFVRLVARQDQLPTHLGRAFGFGSSEGVAKYVFCGDYQEFKGRFLKDILRDMYGGVLEGSNAAWMAIRWRMKPESWNSIRCAPGTLQGAYHLLTDFRDLTLTKNDPKVRQQQALQQMWSMPDSYETLLKIGRLNTAEVEDGHLLYERGRDTVMGCFGIDATYPHKPRGRSEYAARHFFMPNQELSQLDFQIQQLGMANDLIALW